MTIRTVTDFKSLEMLRSSWEGWQDHPNNDFEHFRVVCTLRKEIIHPYVIVAERGNVPVALLAGRMEKAGFSPSIGYFRPVRIPATALIFIHEGMLGQFDSETCREMEQHLRSLFASRDADTFVLYHFPETAPLFEDVLKNIPKKALKKAEWSRHRSMNILKEKGFLLKNMKSKHRSWILGRERKLHDAFQGRISWRWIDSFDDLPRLCEKLENVAERTYQRGLNSGFTNNEEYRRRFSLFAERGQLRVQTLSIDGTVRAFWIGIVYRGVFHSTETAYDPELKKFEVGTLLFVHLVDELVREGIVKLDFGLGDAHYKKRFGSRSWKEATIHVFSKSIKGLFLETILSLFHSLDSLLRRVLTKFGFLDRLKARWRSRLTLHKQPNG